MTGWLAKSFSLLFRAVIFHSYFRFSHPTLILTPRRSVRTDIGGTVRGRGIFASSIHLA